MKKILTEEVEKIAKLARLHLTAEDVEAAREYLAEILAYADRLREVETSGVPLFGNDAISLANVRDDAAVDFQKQLVLLSKQFNENKLMVTKGVFEDNHE